jgi:hypothetical protein
LTDRFWTSLNSSEFQLTVFPAGWLSVSRETRDQKRKVEFGGLNL